MFPCLSVASCRVATVTGGSALPPLALLLPAPPPLPPSFPSTFHVPPAPPPVAVHVIEGPMIEDGSPLATASPPAPTVTLCSPFSAITAPVTTPPAPPPPLTPPPPPPATIRYSAGPPDTLNEPLFVKVSTVHRTPAAPACPPTPGGAGRSAYSVTVAPVATTGSAFTIVSARVCASAPFAFVAVSLIFASPAASG